jgi:hypothetical protein
MLPEFPDHNKVTINIPKIVDKNQKCNLQKIKKKGEKEEEANLLDREVQEKFNLKIIQLTKRLNKFQLQIKSKLYKIKIKILGRQ